MGCIRSLFRFAAAAVVMTWSARFAGAGETPDSQPPASVFSDFRAESPGQPHRITAADLPEPYASTSANNPASKAARPRNALPSAPPGFVVNVFAEGLSGPRAMRTAPNGDVFLAESMAGRIRVFRGVAGGKPLRSDIFIDGLNRTVWHCVLSRWAAPAMGLYRRHRRRAARALRRRPDTPPGPRKSCLMSRPEVATGRVICGSRRTAARCSLRSVRVRISATPT